MRAYKVACGGCGVLLDTRVLPAAFGQPRIGKGIAHCPRCHAEVPYASSDFVHA